MIVDFSLSLVEPMRILRQALYDTRPLSLSLSLALLSTLSFTAQLHPQALSLLPLSFPSPDKLQLIESGNAVPFYLAARHHQAEQLAQVCMYVMASDYPTAEKDPQWGDVDKDTAEQCALNP